MKFFFSASRSVRGLVAPFRGRTTSHSKMGSSHARTREAQVVKIIFAISIVSLLVAILEFVRGIFEALAGAEKERW